MKLQFDNLHLLKRLRYLLCIGLFMLAAGNSYADHFRYGNITWQRVPGVANTMQFKITMAFKRSFFPNSSTIIVGSTRSVGGMAFGDGSANAIITLTITAVNTKDDWFYGEYVTTHTYANPGTYFASYSAGVARLGAPLLKNNASANIAVMAKVQVGNGSTNDAPVSVIPPFINFPIGQSVVSYQIPAIDPNGDTVTYSLTPTDSFGVGCSQPAGLAISSTGLLTWSTTNPSMKVGDLYNTSIRVKDSKGAYISLDVLIKIVSPSLPSTFSPSNPPDGTIIQAQPGETISFQIGASDNPGDTVKLTAYGLPIGATFITTGVNPITGTFTWTPTASQEGDYVLNFVTEDTAGVQNSTTVNLSVSFKPRFNIPTTPGNNSVFTQVPGQLIQHPVVAYHPDALDLVTMNVYGAKPGMSFSPAFPLTAANPVGTIFQWTPAASNWGLNRLAFKATDDFYGESAFDTIYYIIDNPPVITTTPVLYAYADSAYSYVLKAYDTDTPYGDKTKLEVATLPSFLTAANPNASNSWAISGTPTTANIGTYTINFEVADSLNHLFGTHAGNATQTYILKVFAKVGVSGTVANATIFGANNGGINITATGGEGPYTYSWSNSATTEDLSNIGAGTYTVTVTDAHGATATATFTVTQPAQLVVSGTTTNATIYGNSNGAVDITVTGGVGSYIYDWSNNATTEDLSGVAAGTYTVIVADANGATATGTYTVTQPAQLVVSGTVSNATIYGNSNGAVDITVAGGVGPYTYNWSNNSTNEDLANIGAGTYTVTVTDANGATTTGTYTVTQPAQLVVSGTVTNATIYGNSNGSVDITVAGGVGPYTYSWSNNATTEDLSGIAAGTYTVTVTDANGAVKTATYTVTQPALLVVSGTATNATIYGNSNGAIDITITGGVGPYTYSWSNNATTEDLSGLAAGTYTVTVTDANGCIKTATFTVAQPAQLVATAAVTNATIYGNNNGSINIAVTGGVGPYTYSWSNNATTEDLSNAGAGTYTVTVTDANGAVFTATYTITQPAQLAVTGTVSNATIYGNSNGAIDITVTGGVGPYTYSWSNNKTTEDISGIAAGTYTVTVTDANGAVKTATFTVTQPAQLAVSGTVSNATIYGSSNGAVNITVAGGVGPYTYSWSNNAITEDLSGLAAGTYTVTVTDANGAVKTATFTVTQPVQLVATSAVTNATIYGNNNGSINITVTGGVGPYTYSWSNNATTEDLSNVGAGTYTVTVTDANGAVFTATYTITQPAQLAIAGVVSDATIYGNSNGAINITVTGGVGPYTYSWSNNATTEDLSNIAAGTYTVTVTDANGATETMTFTVAQPAQLAVSGVVTNVSSNGGNNGAINITVTGGVGPYTYSWSNSKTTEDISNIAAGTYTVTVTDANGAVKTATFTVTQPSNMAVNISVNPVYTVNGQAPYTIYDGYGPQSVGLSANVTGGVGPYTYSWTPSSGLSNTNTANPVATPTSTKTYIVTVTDANGTIRKDTQVINVVDVNCGNNNNPKVSVCHRNLSCSCWWHTHSASCYSYNTICISVNAVATHLAHGDFLGECMDMFGTATHVACNGGNTGAVSLTVTGGVPPYTYSWSNGATTQNISGVAAGTYTVTVTGADGRTLNETFTVNQPTAITATATVSNTCYGTNNGSINQTISGGTSPYTYAWSNSNVTTQDRSNLAAGTYAVNITDAKGCSISKSYTITQPSSAIAITAAVTNVSCNGDDNGAINITVTGGAGSYTYNWSDNSNNTNNNNHNHNCHSWWGGWCGNHCNNNNGVGTSQDLSNIEAGTYTVTVTDANGCTKTASFTVTEPTAISAGITVTPTVTVTGGQTYTIYIGYGPQSVTLSAAATGGKSPYTYQWSGSGLNSTASSVSVSPTSTKTYTLTVTDANGCTKTVTRTINVVDVRCNSNGNNVKITMCHNGHEICVDQSSVATHLSHGDYIGDCDNRGGCNKESSAENTDETAGSIATAVMTEAADIHVYPNPSNGNFTVELPAGAQNAMIVITDISGKIVEKKTVSNERTVQFDMNSAAKGTYMINVSDGSQSYKSKISIQ